MHFLYTVEFFKKGSKTRDLKVNAKPIFEFIRLIGLDFSVMIIDAILKYFRATPDRQEA